MPTLNFMPRFADAVERGEKRQTIRKRRKDGRDPKPGDTLYLYTGMRTKKCRKLGEAECKYVDKITLGWSCRERGICAMSGSPYTFQETAERDGFENPLELVEGIEKMHGLPFEGLLIRW